MRYVHPADRGLEYDEYKIALKEWETLIKNNLEARRADRLYKYKVQKQVEEFKKYERENKMAEVTHIYADGLFVDIKEINDDFKIIKLGINYEKFTEFLSKYVNSKGYVNIDLKPSKKGGLYAELNTYGMKIDNQQIMSFEEETEEVPF